MPDFTVSTPVDTFMQSGNQADMRTNIGLGNVDNTSDLNKPISTNTQTALNGKANISGQVFSGNISATNLSGTNTGDQNLAPYALLSGGNTWSGAQVFGSASSYPVTTKTANYTVTANDSTVYVDSTSAGFTVTLPTAVGIAGRIYAFKKTSTDANTVVIDPAGSETIDGSLTKDLTFKNQLLVIQSDGANWQSSGEVGLATRTVTANYTATLSDYLILVNSSSGAVTVTLPAAATAVNRVYVVKKTSADGNDVTTDPNGSELIDGSSMFLFNTQYSAITFQSNGTSWFITSAYLP